MAHGEVSPGLLEVPEVRLRTHAPSVTADTLGRWGMADRAQALGSGRLRAKSQCHFLALGQGEGALPLGLGFLID